MVYKEYKEYKEFTSKIVSAILLNGTFAFPISISSLNAIEHLMFFIYRLFNLDYDVDVYIPDWYLTKLIFDNGNIIREKILKCYPLKIKNVKIKTYNIDIEKPNYLLAITKDNNYKTIVKYCPEP